MEHGKQAEPQEGFYERLDRREREARIERLFANRPANLHDYQGCVNDPSRTPVSPPDLRPLVRDAFNLIKAFEDRRCGRSKVFPDFDEVTTWLARAEWEIGDGDGNK